jgi:hypothetical protein
MYLNFINVFKKMPGEAKHVQADPLLELVGFLKITKQSFLSRDCLMRFLGLFIGLYGCT